MSEGSRYSSYYIAEATSGVTPATGALKIFRATKSGLDINVTVLESEELRDDAETTDVRLGTRHVEGTATGELSYETFDDLLAAVLRNNWASNVVTGGILRKSFTFIDYNADIPDLPYTIYRGCEINTMNLTVSASAMVGIEFGIVGRSMEQSATLPTGLTLGTRTTSVPMDAFSGAISMDSGNLDIITEMNIQVENGIEPRFVVGSKFSIKPGSKRRAVSGSMTAYYEDNTLRTKYLQETESVVALDVKDALTGNGYRFEMPRVKITEAPRPVDGEGDIMINMSYRGLLNQTLGRSIRIIKISPMSFTTNLTPTKSIAAGVTLSLPIVVAGGATPYTYVWKKNGVVQASATTATFLKTNSVAGDAGTYLCEVTDAAGQKITSVSCVVSIT